MFKKIKFVWTVPNILTVIRLLLIPVFVHLMNENQMMKALVVFVIASLTDAIDGYIARNYNAISDLGKLLDPLADKLMVLSLMLSMLTKGIVPLSAIIILLIKEALMVIGGLFLLNKNKVVYAMPIGKISQFVVVLALISCFFSDFFIEKKLYVHIWLIWIGVALAILSLIYYSFININSLLKRPKK